MNVHTIDISATTLFGEHKVFLHRKTAWRYYNIYLNIGPSGIIFTAGYTRVHSIWNT